MDPVLNGPEDGPVWSLMACVSFPDYIFVCACMKNGSGQLPTTFISNSDKSLCNVSIPDWRPSGNSRFLVWMECYKKCARQLLLDSKSYCFFKYCMWQRDAQEVCFHSSTSTGFHMEGALEFPPLPPTQEILKLSMVIIVLSQVLNNNLVPDCVRSNLRGSKFKIFPEGHAPRPP